MTTDTDHAMSDEELERRLRLTFATMVPLLNSPANAELRQLDRDAADGLVFEPSRREPAVATRWGARVAAVAAAAALVVGFVVVQRSAVDEPASSDTPNLPAVVAEPGWYTVIRPLLPAGFDRIALTHADQQSVAFVAFRSASDQILDLNITLEPGFDNKETTDPVTFEDDSGTYFESSGGVSLDTIDDRLVGVRCDVTSPLGSSLPTNQDPSAAGPCADASNADPIDGTDLRDLARNLATGFPLDAVNESFGAPVGTDVLDPAIAAKVAEFLGEPAVVIAEQNDLVLREVSLSPATVTPPTSRLTVVTGVYSPPAPPNAPVSTEPAAPPGAGFFRHAGVATAVVVANGTAFHIATSDLSDTNLPALIQLLDQLAATQGAVPVPPPASTVVPDGDQDIAAAPPTTTTPPADQGYTLLGFDLLPDGYQLLDAYYPTAKNSSALARFGNPTNTTELWLVIRNEPPQADLFESLDRTTWQFNGRTVWSDGEGDSCLPDACSIGLQWDDQTSLSLMWTDQQGNNLAPGSDQDSLLALLPALVADDSLPWQEVTELPEPGSNPPAVPIVPGSVVVANGNTLGGSAGRFADMLNGAGFTVAEVVNATSISSDSVIYVTDEAWCLGIQLAYATGITTTESMPNVLPIDQPATAGSPDVLIVLGTETAARFDAGDTRIDLGPVGQLVVVNGTGDNSIVESRLEDLKAAGIQVAAEVASAQPAEETTLHPIGETTPWTCGIADLLGIGGFDTWTPDMINGELPEGTDAVLVIGG